MKVYKGKIITCDAKNTVASTLVEHKGKIVYVGDQLPEKYAAAEVTALGERALLPSFADTHIHFLSYATFNFCPAIMEAKSNVEALRILKNYAATAKEKVIMAFGASPNSVEEKRLITRRELDGVSDKPMFIVKYDGHACVVNSAMIAMLPGDIKKMRGYDGESGEMKQEAFFAVSDFATKFLPPLKLVGNMQRSVDALAAKGIGKIDTVSGVGFPGDLDVTLESLFARGVLRGFQMRVFFQTMDVDKVVKRKLPRVGGCFACALDGAFGSLDAALSEPYEGGNDKGVLYYTDEKVTDFCKKANRAGLQIEMHAIGDAAFNQAAKALKAALDDFPREDHRHGIIHASLPTKEGLAICAEYGIQFPMQPAFTDWPCEPTWYSEELIGEKRTRALNPFREYLDAGIVVSMGSDAPTTCTEPVKWIHDACNTGNGHAVSVYEALRMATYWGYWSTFDEAERGSLEEGKVADMVILSESPCDVPVGELKRIKVEKLLLSGRPYRPQPRGVTGVLLRGLTSGRKM